MPVLMAEVIIVADVLRCFGGVRRNVPVFVAIIVVVLERLDLVWPCSRLDESNLVALVLRNALCPRTVLRIELQKPCGFRFRHWRQLRPGYRSGLHVAET